MHNWTRPWDVTTGHLSPLGTSQLSVHGSVTPNNAAASRWSAFSNAQTPSRKLSRTASRRLDSDATRVQRFRTKTSTSPLEAYYSRHDSAINSTSISNVTRLWAHAAKLYLFVCLSGWQTNSNDTQTCVAEVLRLLQTIDSPTQLRSLSWPICVAGCLASTSQEDDFRRIIGTIGQVGAFGTLSTTLRIMEAVWSSRATIDRDTSDITSCLSILGSPALLS